MPTSLIQVGIFTRSDFRDMTAGAADYRQGGLEEAALPNCARTFRTGWALYDPCLQRDSTFALKNLFSPSFVKRQVAVPECPNVASDISTAPPQSVNSPPGSAAP